MGRESELLKQFYVFKQAVNNADVELGVIYCCLDKVEESKLQRNIIRSCHRKLRNVMYRMAEVVASFVSEDGFLTVDEGEYIMDCDIFVGNTIITVTDERVVENWDSAVTDTSSVLDCEIGGESYKLNRCENYNSIQVTKN